MQAVIFVSLFCAVVGLDNGLVRTPPMGWLSWERFRCNTDCANDPDNCISDKLLKTMADLVASEGYKDAGYEYVIIDDCWLDKDRSPSGELVSDQGRFPDLNELANYIHSKGLKFGIYEDYGNYTCGGYPGIMGHLETDAKSFAKWEVDYIKVDGCYVDPKDMDKGYAEFGYYLNKTGRPIVYGCSMPFFQYYDAIQPDFQLMMDNCNMWRNFDDIADSWASIESIIDFWGEHQDVLIPVAGPGHWNDPDMLVIGNYGLSLDQSKAQMAIWAIIAAPLIMSTDLRTIRAEHKEILLNKKIIAVNQDPLGIQGRRILKNNGIELWVKPVTPTFYNYHSYAIAVLNRRTDGAPSHIQVSLSNLGLVSSNGYQIENLYEDVEYGLYNSDSKLNVTVNPTGVVMLKAVVQPIR